MKNKKDNLSYDEAISRLENLVNQLEEGEQGMDDLTKMVKEASDLVKVCKQKLKMTADEIKKAFDEEQELIALKYQSRTNSIFYLRPQASFYNQKQYI